MVAGEKGSGDFSNAGRACVNARSPEAAGQASEER
jgi:hypothetical protein